MAANYFDALNHEKVFLYAVLQSGRTTYGHCTSNVVEVTNNVVGEARFDDLLHFLDSTFTWCARNYAARQDAGLKLVTGMRLITNYASSLYHKAEHMAQMENLAMEELGNKRYLLHPRCIPVIYPLYTSYPLHTRYIPLTYLLHTPYIPPRYLVSHIKNKDVEDDRYYVDIINKKCTCLHWCQYRIPCAHVLFVADSKGLRDTEEKCLKFRDEWVPAQFWTEHYVNGYSDISVHVPSLVSLKCLREVLPPPAKAKKGRPNIKRKIGRSRGRAGRRSRARWNAKAYTRRREISNGRAGPTNGFVRITNTEIFQKKPQGM